MVLTGRLKRALVAIIATFSLLFVQLAVAGCVRAGPADAAGSVPVAMDVVSCTAEAQPVCGHMDAARATLCAAQAYASNDITPAFRIPKPPIVAADAWFKAFSAVADSDEFLQPSPHPSPGLTRAILPSLSIRNCCYRI